MTVLSVYITLLPTILTGIMNMAFIKSSYMKNLQIPIDNNRLFIDGKAVLGKNKTYKGFIGMTFIGAFLYVIYGALVPYIPFLAENNLLYLNFENTIFFNFVFGIFQGFSYVLFEIPNSFIKRRFSVRPGITEHGWKFFVFGIFDQIDSMFGIILILYLYIKIPLDLFIISVIIGGISHLLVNIILYAVKLKRNI